ncbi:hypothetical protein Poli38472_011451 [Pythium oligandrum]|uniref:Uncharacterized protein n=1 Tax=Pythium oligandrum TaxID=41045 RepID=A0A8K1CKU4_PYTOL|nr:hypothetical protein Poli38472_011451 [Pythium oligandrum]|eukprot:TMW64571.1 hypothetical protein Poli38472_011451 [Pythium oligandrum]
MVDPAAFRVCVDIYTITSFLLTSSLVQGLYTETAVFIDDLFNGLYDFTPRSPTDDRILSEFQEAKTLWSRDTLFVGYQDARHNDLGTASHCYRLGVDIGAYMS